MTEEQALIFSSIIYNSKFQKLSAELKFKDDNYTVGDVLSKIKQPVTDDEYVSAEEWAQHYLQRIFSCIVN